MSWNLMIGPTSGSNMGSFDSVRAIFDTHFPTLEWDSQGEARLPEDQGFILELHGDPVSDVYTHGGYYHLKQFSAAAKQGGWYLADCQFGEEIDLDDPYSLYPPDTRP